MTTPEDVSRIVKEVLSRMMRRGPEEIELEHTLDKDLDVDSMDAVDLVVDLETELGVRFGQTDVEAVETVQDIVDRVLDKLE